MNRSHERATPLHSSPSALQPSWSKQPARVAKPLQVSGTPSQVGAGGVVNLERSLRPDSKMGGHFVTGHIDGPGEIAVLEPRGADRYLRIRYPAQYRGLLVPKGSIAVDGVSLTVVEVTPEWFSIWLIPHTMEVTNLGGRKAGDQVNLEYDMLAKYVDRLLALREDAARNPQAALPVKPVWQS